MAFRIASRALYNTATFASRSASFSKLCPSVTSSPVARMAQTPFMYMPKAGIRIKKPEAGTPNRSEQPGMNHKEDPKDTSSEQPQKKKQETLEQEPEDAQGMDLLAQALAAQKRREAEAAAGSAGQAGGSQAAGDEGMDPAEAERLRKWKEAAEEEERKQMARSGRIMLGSLLLMVTGGFIYLGMPDETQQLDADEPFFKNHHKRAWENLKKMRTTINSPTLEKLLPDPLPAPYQRALTLCVELNDALSHLEWDKSEGWRIATRPGVKQFLTNLGRYYEVVIFTNSPGYLAEPVCQALDPHFFYAMYRLYRDHTKLIDGVYVKDLSQLNRDLSKVIVMDVNPESYKLQPENGVQLKPWKGERGDRELRKMETFLEELYVFMTMYGIEDVRPVLQIVNTINPHDPAAAWETYKQRAREEFNKREQEHEAQTKPVAKSWLSSLLGGGVQQQPKPLNVIDQIEAIAREERALAIKDAEAMKKQMDEIQAQQEAFIKKQMEENKNKGLKFWDYMNGAGMPAPPGEQPPAAA
ncbi:HAD-like domain-containing protein [Gaertneriomyces semiglobifer]|nr:HAD-like domain-containing protein [Gaertneriomyces semiglobifer]